MSNLKPINFQIKEILKVTESVNNTYLNDWGKKYSYFTLILVNGKEYKANINTVLSLRKDVTYFSKNFDKKKNRDNVIYYIKELEPITPDAKFQLLCELYKGVPELMIKKSNNLKSIALSSVFKYPGQDSIFVDYIEPLLSLYEQYYQEIGFDFLLNLFHHYSFIVEPKEIDEEIKIFIYKKNNLYPIASIKKDPFFTSIANLYAYDELEAKVDKVYPLKSISLIHELFLQSIGRFRGNSKTRFFYNDRYSYLTFNEVYKHLSSKNVGITKEILGKILEISIKFNILVQKENRYYLKEIWDKELYVENKISSMINLTPSYNITEPLIDAASKPMKHGKAQKQAISKIASTSHGIDVLTGGPGTGKTTTLKTIVKLNKAIYQFSDEDMLFLAPTKKAVGVMSESLGREAFTVKEAILSKKVQRARFVVIDEVGVVSLFDFYDLLLQCNNGQKIVLMGDDAQLQSIEFGTILKDIKEHSMIEINHLDEVFRQGDGSPILDLTYAIDSKKVRQEHLQSNGENFIVERMPSLPGFIQTLDLDLNFFDNLDNIQIICPTNTYSRIREYTNNPSKFFSLSADNVNAEIQRYRIKKFNVPYVQVNGKLFVLGDKVMHNTNMKKKVSMRTYKGKQLKPVRGIFNGDTGIVIDIVDNKVIVQFTNGSVFAYDTYSGGNNMPISHLQVAYAITTMKSQGSEWDTVFMLLDDNPKTYPAVNRNNLYVGASRSKKNLIIAYNFTKQMTILKYFQDASKVSSSDKTRSDLFQKK